MPSMIDESTAKVLLQDARATITRKRGGKFLVVDRRLFEVDNVDGTTTLYIICDVERVKP